MRRFLFFIQTNTHVININTTATRGARRIRSLDMSYSFLALCALPIVDSEPGQVSISSHPLTHPPALPNPTTRTITTQTHIDQAEMLQAHHLHV